MCRYQRESQAWARFLTRGCPMKWFATTTAAMPASRTAVKTVRAGVRPDGVRRAAVWWAGPNCAVDSGRGTEDVLTLRPSATALGSATRHRGFLRASAPVQTFATFIT